MKNYSIVRIGNEYVVQANEKSVLKISSRRKAARLVTDAADYWIRSRPRWRLRTRVPSHQPPVIPA
jgi:hypothetical protein